MVLDMITQILEKGIVVIKDLINTIVPGDIPLLIVGLIVAYLIERADVKSWKIWIPMGVTLFLLLKFAGG